MNLFDFMWGCGSLNTQIFSFSFSFYRYCLPRGKALQWPTLAHRGTSMQGRSPSSWPSAKWPPTLRPKRSRTSTKSDSGTCAAEQGHYELENNKTTANLDAAPASAMASAVSAASLVACRVACARCSWERAENWALLISAVVRPSTGSVVIHRPSEPESQFLVAQRNSKKCVRPCTCKL